MGTTGSAKDQDWRKLAVEVTPKAIAIFWEDEAKPLAVVPMTDITEFTDIWWTTNRPGPVPPPRFAGGGSLGLLIQRGSAEFRNVTLELVKGDKP